MPRTTVTVGQGYGNRVQRKYQGRSQLARINRSNAIMGRRMAAPLRTGGFFGVQYRRSMNEKKTVDTDSVSYNADTTGTSQLLNGVATGTDFTDRIGRKIILKSLQVQGWVQPIDDSTGFALCRLLVVYDMQSNGAAPAITDILKSATSEANINLNNRDRFKILFDKRFMIGKVTNTTTQTYAASPTCFKVQLYRKLNLETLYNGTTNAVGSIATGAVYAWVIGNLGANAGGFMTLSTRIRFVDA